jgi:hypothetical protein
MQRRKLTALAIVAVIICSSALVILLYIQEPPPEEPEITPPIIPHPFNKLSWWEIAWELGVDFDFLDALEKIVETGSREDFSDEFEDAAEWIIKNFEAMSISASRWGPHESVVGLQEGYGTDNRAIVLGAHLDSRGRGVNQNAGGCATIMMIAAILSQFRLPIDIYYCFFAGNLEIIDPFRGKHALYGAHEVAEKLKDDGIDVIVFLNFDELLFMDPKQDEELRLLVEYGRPEDDYHKTRYLADLFVQFMVLSGLNIVTARYETQTDTDHQAFWSRGFTALNIRSGHFINAINPPADSLNDQSYNKTQAILAGRSAATMVVYLGLKGNGEPTIYKRELILEPFEKTSIRTVMSISQILVIYGSTGINSSISIQIENNTKTLLYHEIYPETNFTYECNFSTGLGPLFVYLSNIENSTSSIEIFLKYDSDTDGDQILDSEQYSWPNPDPPLDWDKDDVSDEEEGLIGTDIFVSDTDGDSISDGQERDYGLNPLRDDSAEDLDGDGLTNIEEINLGTHPGKSDTDDDGLPDWWEVDYGLNPLANDSGLDPDNDTLTNLEEYTYGSHPLSADGDEDGIPDVDELNLGMNPLDEDTDNDGLRDQLEVLEGLDPLAPDSDIDLAPDGPDHNPRINALLILLLFISVPVVVASIVFRRLIK